MSHEMIDEIQSRKGEKVALFLTFENAAGLILGVLPAFILSGAMPWWLRILIVLAAGAVGVLATLEVGGLAFYERVTWAVRGTIAKRAEGERITPEQLVGAPTVGRRDRALPIDGPIRAVTVRKGVLGQGAHRSHTRTHRLPVPSLGVADMEPIGAVQPTDHSHNGYHSSNVGN
jgi:hypothetical protein